MGAALLLAGVLVGVLGRALHRIALAAGLLVTTALTFLEWQANHDLALAGGILVAGVVAWTLLAAIVRFVSVLLVLGLFSGGWYLLVYATMGSAFVATTPGLATWGIAAVLSALVVDFLSRRRGPQARLAQITSWT